ncbi:hypothetical protein HanIR_Chr03g0139441 [Helianthus annuus]|nr:hypothetical protein HanIR_Chr03g0139441 [Helianthus annuus]
MQRVWTKNNCLMVGDDMNIYETTDDEELNFDYRQKNARPL